MRAAWRLATSSWRGSPGRTALLVGAVTLSAALVSAVSSALASANAAIEARVATVVGQADVRIHAASSNGTFDRSLLDEVRSWPEVARAGAIREQGLRAGFTSEVLVEHDGVWTPGEESYLAHVMVTGLGSGGLELRPISLMTGRMPENEHEIVIDVLLAVRLSWYYEHVYEPEHAGRAERVYGVARPENPGRYERHVELPAKVTNEREARRLNERTGPKLGDEITLRRLLRSETYTVVGIAAQPPLGGRPRAFTTTEGLARIAGHPGEIGEIGLVLRDGFDPAEVARERREQLGRGFLVQESERVTTDAEGNVRSSQLGFVLISTLAFLSASFIILTGLSTDVAQRQRELAILRCVGAMRGQMAAAQLLVGFGIGLAGAVIGVPAGLGIAWVISVVFRDRLAAGLSFSPVFIVVAFAGTIMAGVLGAAWPAWRVARLTPLEGLSVRALPATARGRRLVTICGLLGLAIQAGIIGGSDNGQFIFWGYATFGLPVMFAGYFLLGVPTVLVIARVAGPWLSRRLGLGPRLLPRAVEATPYTHGFTAGAMMSGLALMVAIWTTGGSVLRDWLDRISFPDAFVSGPALTDQTRAMLDALPFVVRTSAVGIQPVETDAFGVHGLQTFKTSFIGFDPAPFFEMTKLDWIQGDRATAQAALEKGGAVIVAKEFNIAKGLGVGDTFRCRYEGVEHDFRIVGVVDAPGLHLVSKFFNIGDEVVNQSLHAVFGSRDDLKRIFGNDTAQMIQIDLSDDVDDETAIATIRETLADQGLLDAGSGRKIKDEIVHFVRQFLAVFTAIAIVSMGVASCGVANIVIAGIHARRFEFGVLRAVGAQRGTLVRLILGEALIIALGACVLGTLMGLQGAWAGVRLQRLLNGIELSVEPPWGAIGFGSAVVILLTMGAAAPAVWRLSRRHTRELLMGAGG